MGNLWWRMQSILIRQDKWVFVVRSEDVERHRVHRIFDELKLDYSIITVDHTTSGQAATCLLAADDIDDDAELLSAHVTIARFLTRRHGNKFVMINPLTGLSGQHG